MIELLLNRDLTDIMIGAGTMADLLPNWFIVNDNGLIFYIFYSFGFAGIIYLALIFIPIARKLNWVTIAIFGLLLISKIKLTYPMFWYCWAVLCISIYNSNIKVPSIRKKQFQEKKRLLRV